MISRAFYWLVFIAFVVAATWVILWSVSDAESADDPPVLVQGRDVWRWREIALERDETARAQASTIRRLRRTLRHDGSVVEAVNLAAVTYGVNGRLLFRLARCESHLNPRARNRNSGAAGLMQFLPSTWRSTPYRRLSVWSPYANALAAAHMISRGRRGEWVC